MQEVYSVEEERSLAAVPDMHYGADHYANWGFGQMAGRSPVMQRLFSQMRHTARHLRVASIEGESGTGKMLAAHTLHESGPDPQSPFVPCTASQFFEGQPATPQFSAFQLLKQASGGTLVLTRIDELSPLQQANLLELLQWIDHQHILRALDSIPRQILCLSGRQLRKLASIGVLRTDLVNRLTAIRFTLPPLRERRDDIPLLSDLFVQRFSSMHTKPVRGLGPQTLPRLVQHFWPGNVRELENVISAAVLASHSQWIRPIDLPALNKTILAPEVSSPSAPANDDDPNLDHAILRHIHAVLAHVDGNKFRAAKLLGISRSTLYRLLDSASVSNAV